MLASTLYLLVGMVTKGMVTKGVSTLYLLVGMVTKGMVTKGVSTLYLLMAANTALSDQGSHSPYILKGVYYLKDSGSRPYVWYRATLYARPLLTTGSPLMVVLQPWHRKPLMVPAQTCGRHGNQGHGN